MNFCSQCGSSLSVQVPEGDNRPRHVCTACHTISYLNPKIVAGCILEWQQRVLLCRRAIEPRHGLWTLPAGFMENGEERLTTRTISYIAKEGLKAIGLNEKAFTAHSLRHTTAVNILRAGGSLETAQFTLRHSNPATTQIYTATLNEERRLQNSGEALIDSLY